MFDTGLRTITCWVRVRPREGVGKPTTISGLYRTKRQAKEKKKPGELLVQLKGMYAPPPE